VERRHTSLRTTPCLFYLVVPDVRQCSGKLGVRMYGSAPRDFLIPILSEEGTAL
jgi:hypothetical protein